MGMCQSAAAVVHAPIVQPVFEQLSLSDIAVEVRGSTFAEEGFDPDLITVDTKRHVYYTSVRYDGVVIVEPLRMNYCDHILIRNKYRLIPSPPFNDIRAKNLGPAYDILQELRKARAHGLIKSTRNLVVTCIAEERRSGQALRRVQCLSMGANVLGEFMVPSDEPCYSALVASLLKLELGDARPQELRLVLLSQDGDVLWDDKVASQQQQARGVEDESRISRSRL